MQSSTPVNLLNIILWCNKITVAAPYGEPETRQLKATPGHALV
ncbi:MAG: hypothetical protein CFH05_01386 [Alphaproteobacteria bacterium MarineAlpha3_Bin4]|nr:MAG: hypothetical protein CFH05_01386 [Alphaproteobacteria bacterium MarineAlpha3_Bin4]